MTAAKRSRFIGFIYVLSTLKVALRLSSVATAFSYLQVQAPPFWGKIKGCTLPQQKASGKRFRTARAAA